MRLWEQGNANIADMVQDAEMVAEPKSGTKEVCLVRTQLALSTNNVRAVCNGTLLQLCVQNFIDIACNKTILNMYAHHIHMQACLH